MLISDSNKGTSGFVDFDKPWGTAPGGLTDTFVLANLKDEGHTLMFIFSSRSVVASRQDMISYWWKGPTLCIRCYKENIPISFFKRKKQVLGLLAFICLLMGTKESLDK